MNEFILALLEDWGITGRIAFFLSRGIIIVCIALLSIIANFLAKKVILALIGKIISKTKFSWDDIVFKRGVFSRLSHLAPALVIYYMARIVFPEADIFTQIVERFSISYMIGVTVFVLFSFLDSVNDIYQTFNISKTRPIKGYLQIVKIFVFLVGFILIITTLTDTSPVGILSGIGALSAVLLLVFKDSILGFVASIQLAANNLVHIGDWIELPKYGADGDVIDITLQSIKVQNFDKTIVTIPLYALISDSFKNWRGMEESGGRRIKRSINIDMRSVQFCTREMITRYRNIGLLKGYIAKKEGELDEYNRVHGLDNNPLNNRNLTNLGTFRAYISSYLHNHPKVRDDMTFLVRQLQPGPTGIPLEIYVFSNDQAWANYESIQADIFDHLLAAISEFDLRLYQEPSGFDLQSIADALSN
jgi:miniconductance mechanosensitive channel